MNMSESLTCGQGYIGGATPLFLLPMGLTFFMWLRLVDARLALNLFTSSRPECTSGMFSTLSVLPREPMSKSVTRSPATLIRSLFRFLWFLLRLGSYRWGLGAAGWFGWYFDLGLSRLRFTLGS